jgi:FkbM family methyltransferase
VQRPAGRENVTLKAIANKLPSWLKRPLMDVRARLFDTYAVKSYSQEGEDLILLRMFAKQPSGFYVDVGAHHPRRFSNTFNFYRRGWTGINIDPNPDAMRSFQSARNRDINIQCGVADRPGTLTYYRFDEAALNTFDRDLVKSRLANTPYKLIGNIEVRVEGLAAILERHLPVDQAIDFLTIDAEGMDLQVLKSNDWKLYRPRCVLVESLGVSLEDALRGEVFLFMRDQGYELFARTFNTLVFRESADGGVNRPRKIQ